jgi:ribosomal protein S12 methylthiotransferase accessory factor
MSTHTVGLAGSSPAIDAVRAALVDADTETVECDPQRVGAADFAVVAAVAGADAFAAANASAREGGTPWLAVELGGIAGYAVDAVDAGIAGFAPATACYECLRTRVGANRDDEAEVTPADSAGRATVRFAGALAGREAATLLAGGESQVLGGVIEVPHAERRVLPVPGCDVCGDDLESGTRDSFRDREYAEVDFNDALARAEQAVDQRVGAVSSVGEAESFPAPYYLATLADTTAFSDAQAAEQAAGVATDWNEALMKALGEALERYSAGVYRESSFRVARADELGAAVDPTAFVRPDDWSSPDSDVESAWVEGQNLHASESTFLPAEFVHFPPPEARHKPSITTGLGLGNSTAEALLSGLYEAIERDATMLAWYSSFEPLGLSVESEQFDALRRRARAEDLDVTALLVTLDVDVPVVAVAVHPEVSESGDSGARRTSSDGGEWPRFAVGSGADLDPDAAATAALAEALQNWMELRSMGPDDATDADGAIGEYADFPATAREFVAPETTVPSASVGPSDPPAGEAELDAVLDRLADADLSAYAARLTPRDVAQLGFEAVRVLVPEAQPLFTGEAYFGERARAVPTGMGFEFRPDRPQHPYP